jgi:hypothetical protein
MTNLISQKHFAFTKEFYETDNINMLGFLIDNQ